MSSDLAVSVRGLGKDYTIVHNDAPATSAAEALTRRLRHPLRRPRTETFSALEDVSFDIHEGDIVGIIGKNGAGKSTILKILSRIVEPTRGEVHVYGRVGALLEVGSGFHPELTGRENVYLNGSILGLRRKEIDAKFDEIVAFSEVEQFLDTPVKRYSSGMTVRLAFAVAAHIEPEILIIDEVLAVGDAAFQAKCLGKMGEVARDGRTVIFVSHNLQIVKQLCQSAALLEHGRLTHAGDVLECIERYQEGNEEQYRTRASFARTDDDVSLLAASAGQLGTSSALVTTRPTDVALVVEAHGLARSELACGAIVLDHLGGEVFSTYFGDLGDLGDLPPVLDGTHELRFTIPANFLNEGWYRLVFDVAIAKLKRTTDPEVHAIDIKLTNVEGVGSRFGLGLEWRGSAVLPYLPWSATAQTGDAA